MTTAILSPIARRVRALRLHQASALAIARAKKQAARDETRPNTERRALARMGRRQEACALSFHLRLHTPVGDATRIELRNPRSCMQPTCFLCARRKARTVRDRLVKLLHNVHGDDPGTVLLFATLTLRNEPWANLAAMCDRLAAAERRLFAMPAIKAAFTGRISSLEVVCRGTEHNPEAGAHLHLIVAAPSTYFDTDKTLYVSQARLTALFKDAARIDYKPIVHIARVRAPDGSTGGLSFASAAAECGKYCVKPAELFARGTERLIADPDVIAVLVKALHGRRMLKISGAFSKASRRINRNKKEEPATT